MQQRIVCLELVGPARLTNGKRSDAVRLMMGLNNDLEDVRSSMIGDLNVLPGQKMAITIDLDAGIASFLGGSANGLRRMNPPPGSWWLKLNVLVPAAGVNGTAGSDIRLGTIHDIEPLLAGFRQREVHLLLDDEVEPRDFEDFVDFVSFSFVKELAEDSVHSEAHVFDEVSAHLRSRVIRYPWNGQDTDEWIKYRYRSVWEFREGKHFDSGWVETDDFVLLLNPPYQRRQVQLDGDSDLLRGEGVDSVSVEIAHEFMGDTRIQRNTFSPEELYSGEVMELFVDPDRTTYDYTVTWHRAVRDDVAESASVDDGYIYIDEPPDQRK